MKTLPEIEKELGVLCEKMKNVKGRETEVYTRIVGYHRDVRNWNRGKREEYKHRLTFKANQDQVSERMKVRVNEIYAEKQKEKEEKILADNVTFYKFFYSQVCRNCPPVKDYVKNLTIPGEEVDVTSDLGLNSARKYDVMSTPTVILFDKNDEVVEKLNSVEDLKKIFSK